MKNFFKSPLFVWNAIFITLFVWSSPSASAIESLNSNIQNQQPVLSASIPPPAQASIKIADQSVGFVSALSTPNVAPPPGAIVDPKDTTGSWAIRTGNNFSDLTGRQPGTFEFVEAQIRTQALAGAPSSLVTTYQVFNNKGVLKRIEEYVFADVDKTILTTIITRFYDTDREVHVEKFLYVPPGYAYVPSTYTPPAFTESDKLCLTDEIKHYLEKPTKLANAPQPHIEQTSVGQNILYQWDIWNPRGKPLLSIDQKQSDRTFDPVTGVNNHWISTDYDSQGHKIRVFEKNPDGSNRKITYYNLDGSVQREEILTPVINPSKISGPIYAVSRLKEPLPVATSNEAYVRSLYLTLLARGAENSGLAYWTNLINSGSQSRLQVYQGFLNSIEYRSRIIEAYYQTYLNRLPDNEGLQYWANSGYSLNQVAEKILNSNEGYVVNLYRVLLERRPDDGGRNYWVSLLNTGRLNRNQIYNGFYHSTEYRRKVVTGFYGRYLVRTPAPIEVEWWANTNFSIFQIATMIANSNEAYVVSLYQNIFGRNPDDGGRYYWTGLLNSGWSRKFVWASIYNWRKHL